MDNLVRDAVKEHIFNEMNNKHRFIAHSDYYDRFPESRKTILLVQGMDSTASENIGYTNFGKYVEFYLFVEEKYFDPEFLMFQREIMICKKDLGLPFNLENNEVVSEQFKKKVYNYSPDYDEYYKGRSLYHVKRATRQNFKHFASVIERANIEKERLLQSIKNINMNNSIFSEITMSLDMHLLTQELYEVIVFYLHVKNHKTNRSKKNSWFLKFQNEINIITEFEKFSRILNFLTLKERRKRLNCSKDEPVHKRILKIISIKVGCSVNFVKKTLEDPNLREFKSKIMVLEKDIVETIRKDEKEYQELKGLLESENLEKLKESIETIEQKESKDLTDYEDLENLRNLAELVEYMK